MKPSELITKARDLISDPARWTTHAFARDAEEKRITPQDPLAVKWCAYGAIKKVDTEGTLTLLLVTAHYLNGLTRINDEEGYEAVLAFLDKAVQEAKEAEKVDPL